MNHLVDHSLKEIQCLRRHHRFTCHHETIQGDDNE